MTCDLLETDAGDELATFGRRGMRTRTKPGLAANTFPEVRRGVKIAAELLEEDVKIEGERWEQGHLIEAWTAACLVLPHDVKVWLAQLGQEVIVGIRLREKPGAPLSEADAPKGLDVSKGWGGEGAASPPKGTAVVRPPSVASGSLDRAPRKNDQATKREAKGGRRPLGK
jgi:hypothetical protein